MADPIATADFNALRTPARPRLAVVLAHIDGHLSESLCLTDLAGLMHLSIWRFATVFREEMGISPYRYIHRRRLSHAQALLRQGLPAAWVASEAGFYDQSHLTRCFRRELGITPGQFQEQGLVDLGHSRLSFVGAQAHHPSLFSTPTPSNARREITK